MVNDLLEDPLKHFIKNFLEKTVGVTATANRSFLIMPPANMKPDASDTNVCPHLA